MPSEPFSNQSRLVYLQPPNFMSALSTWYVPERSSPTNRAFDCDDGSSLFPRFDACTSHKDVIVLESYMPFGWRIW